MGLGWVVAPRSPGMATAYPPETLERSSNRSILLDRFDHVLRARG
jgi:hypothetical protein